MKFLANALMPALHFSAQIAQNHTYSFRQITQSRFRRSEPKELGQMLKKKRKSPCRNFEAFPGML